jgi:hypothetical protein
MADTTGLGSLSKETVAAVAADPTSSDILTNMQARANELTSPWHKFQSDLDLMVARSHYNPESAVSSVQQQRNLEEGQLQNIYGNMAQIGLLRNQLGNMRSTYDQLQGAPNQQGMPTGQSQATSSASQPTQGQMMSPTGDLTDLQLAALRTYVKNNDIAGFQTKLAEFANTNASKKLESQYNWGRYDILENVPIQAPDGKIYHVSTTKEELDRYKRNPLDLPVALGGRVEPGYPGPQMNQAPVQKKATGGIMRPQLADGGQPPVDPMTQQSTMPQAGTAPVMPGSGMQGGMLDTALSSLMGSAEAAPQGQVTVQGWKPPEVANTQNYGFQKQTAQSGLQQGEEQNKAELKSLEEERIAAGKFIADLQNQSFSPTTLQKAQEIIDMSKEHPGYFGYGYKSDPIGIMMGLTGATEDPAITDEASRNTSRLASIKQQFQGEGAMEKRSRLNQLAKELGIAYEKEQFGGTGSKMGAQLTTISQAAKGLGANFPASQNIAQALTIQLVHERNSELAKEWNSYKSTVKNPDPYVFMMAPKTQAILNKWNVELNNQVSKVMNKPAEGSEDKDVDGNPIVFKNGQWMRVKK